LPASIVGGGFTPYQALKEVKSGGNQGKILRLLGSRTFRGDDFFCEWEALAATRLAADRAIDGPGASRALARRLADFIFTNRIADTDDHEDRLHDNAKHSQELFRQ
jgi:hypothetical protein